MSSDPRGNLCPRDGSQLWIVEYSYNSPEHYDGWSERACPNPSCGYRRGRWTGLEIPKGFVESRWGERGLVPIS